MPAASRRATRASAALAAIVAATVIAGCGGSSGGLSDSAFLAKAKGVVCPLRGEFVKLESEKPSGMSEIPAYAQRAATLFGSLKQKLAGLSPPSDKSAAYSRLLSTLDKFDKTMGEVAQAATAGDASRVLALGHETEALGSQLTSAGNELGGGECPEAPSTTSTSTETQSTATQGTETQSTETQSTETTAGGGSETTSGTSAAAATPYGAWSAEKTHGLELLLESYPNRACVVRYVEEHESPPGSSATAEALAKQAASTCGG
jgi:hypothetical protein